MIDQNDLVHLAHSGYAAISVSGTLSKEAPPHEDVDDPPELMELREMIAVQYQSTEVQIIGEILLEEYHILQTVPATSEPVPRLSVHVEIGAVRSNGTRRVDLTIELSERLDLWRSEGEVVISSRSSLEETYSIFRDVMRSSLSHALSMLKPVTQNRPF